MSKTYTVYVGGDEVNDYYLTYDEACFIAKSYIDNGYDDVQIQNTSDDKNYEFINNKWQYVFTANEHYQWN